MTETPIQFGWKAPKIAEQFPTMDPATAEMFQRDQIGLARLCKRGVLTAGEQRKALYRLSKKIRSAVE